MFQNLLFRNCAATAVVVDSGSTAATVRFANCVFLNNNGAYDTKFGHRHEHHHVREHGR